MPSAFNCFTVCFACTSLTCGKNSNLKPRVILKKKCKTLTYHTCCADYTDIILFFHGNVSFLFLQ